MIDETIVQGRALSRADLEQIRGLIAAQPQWSRWRLSRVLCERWRWCNAAGRFKDMAARTMLLKLHQRGLIALPPRRRVPFNRMRSSWAAPWGGQTTPVECALSLLQPLRVEEVSSDPEGRRTFASALRHFHYLGHGGTVGENLQYIVLDRQGRPLAFLLFGAAAWKCGDRDRWIGWTVDQRQRHLHQVTNNTRFLILPWVRVPHLASWALAAVLRGLSTDWRAKYGHGVELVETFVERGRFRATAYRAANWMHVGSTTGRTRQDRHHDLQRPVKDVYLHGLRSDVRERLRYGTT